VVLANGPWIFGAPYCLRMPGSAKEAKTQFTLKALRAAVTAPKKLCKLRV